MYNYDIYVGLNINNIKISSKLKRKSMRKNRKSIIKSFIGASLAVLLGISSALACPKSVDAESIEVVNEKVQREPAAEGELAVSDSIDADAKYEILSDQIIKLYDNTNGLSSNEANVVYQTEDGFIWIGSYTGLTRFDGTEFINFSLNDSKLPMSGIRSLYQDRSGNLWIGTNDSGMYVYDKEEFREIKDDENNSLPSIRTICEDKDGSILAGTASGIFAYESGAESFTKKHLGYLDTQTIYTLDLDENGALWGIDSSNSVFAIKDGKTLINLSKGDYVSEDYYTLYVDKNEIYIGTIDRTIIAVTMKDDKYTRDSFDYEIINTGELNTISSISKTKDGNIWFGTSNGTAWFGSDYVVHTDDEMLKCQAVVDIFEDYEGSLWLSSSKLGVYKIMDGVMTHVANESSNLNESVNAIIKSGELFYIATDTGLAVCNADMEPYESELVDVFKSLRIRDVMSDKYGNIWISTYSEKGLGYYDVRTGSLKFYTDEDGMLSNWIRKTYQLSNGDVAVLTSYGVNIISNGKITKSYGINEGLTTPLALCMIEDEDGSLLVGTDGGGVFRIKDKMVSHVADNGFDAFDVVLRLYDDKEQGGIWISSGNSLYFYDRATSLMKEITVIPLGVGSVMDVYTQNGITYVVKSNGVYITSAYALRDNSTEDMVFYGQESGLTGNMNANAWNYYSEEVIYFCTSMGICGIDGSGEISDRIPAKIAVDSIKIQTNSKDEYCSYEDIISGKVIELPSDTKRLTIDFACLSYTGSDCEIHYQLEGFDEEQNLIDAAVYSATYTNLAGGEYTFNFTAYTHYNVSCENPITIKFVKKYKLIERWWIHLILFIASLALIGTITIIYTKRRTKKALAEQARYKNITDQSLQTIANTVDAKDKYTNGHSIRVATYSREIAKRLGLSEKEQEEIYFTGLLHDIGKIGIPDAILNKKGKLTDEEFAVMKSHTTIGSNILKDLEILPEIGDGARWHHEKIDGTGYPDGLVGDKIPYRARIICVADSYDAMSTNRPYRDALSFEYIIGELERCKGTQFEPEIVDVMIEMIKEKIADNEKLKQRKSGDKED